MRIALLICIITSCSCSLETNKKASVFVVVVENLGVNKVTCHKEDSFDNSVAETMIPTAKAKKISGFQMLCEDGIRFTHAFVNSTQTAANLATILTGKYPYEHGLRYNGESYISSEEITFPELYRNKNYRTYFISGGAPILRYTNLNQGFEYFNDHFFEYPKKWFKPVKEIFEDSQDIIKDTPKNKDLLAVHYLTDIAFPNAETKDMFGEIRAKKVESQVDEVDYQLGEYIQFLKQQNRWKNSYFFLIGSTDVDSYDLQSKNTQITLIIKPPTNPTKDLGQYQKSDAYVSMVDVGNTLFEIFDPKFNQNNNKNILQKISLMSFLQPESNKFNNSDPSDEKEYSAESILIESPEKNGFSYALRKQQFLTILSNKEKVVRHYNTQIDRPEALPQTKKISDSANSAILQILSNLKLSDFEKDDFDEKKNNSIQDKKCKALIEKVLQKKESAFEFDKICKDNLSYLALSFYRNEDPELSDSYQKLFQSKYQVFKMDQTIANMNVELNYLWFFNKKIEKNYLDYILSKKEFKTLKDSLSNIN